MADNEILPRRDDSRIAGVSIRGWITVMLVFTVCVMAATGTTVTEPLYGLVTMAVGFYLGQKTTKQ